MPMPKPRSGESQDTFISRCMSESDIPTANDQRLAACFRAWRDRSKDQDMTGRGAVRVRTSPFDDADE